VKKGYHFPCSRVHNDRQAQTGNGSKYPLVPGPNWPSSSQRDSPLMLAGTHSRRTNIPAPEFVRNQNKFQSADRRNPFHAKDIKLNSAESLPISRHPAFSCLQTSQTRYVDNFLKSITTPSPVPYTAISFFFVRYVTAVNIQVQLNAIKSHSVFNL